MRLLVNLESPLEQKLNLKNGKLKISITALIS
jgi:hypothetical protein